MGGSPSRSSTTAPASPPTTGNAFSNPSGTSGVGLGLAVARGFIQAMDGTISLTDTPGGGLTVLVTLPRHQREQREIERGQAMTRVLIVDDEPPILRALRINLRARGYTVDLAPSREQALELAADHHPDVVVLDLGLPGIVGLEVIRGLRGWSQVPIIVLSVREREADKIAALDAGADDYVTKPFGIGELLARLRAAARRTRPATQDAVVQTVDFRVDLAAERVTTSRGEVRLTPTESPAPGLPRG